MSPDLNLELGRWKTWARSADKSYDGWESAYPNWNSLMEAAQVRMTKFASSDLAALEECWRISEETEDLVRFSRENIDSTLPALEELARSKQPEVRWQIYASLDSGGAKPMQLLRTGLTDTDSYARRRALLSLAKFHPADAKYLAEKFSKDIDPYLRQASLEMARSADDEAFLQSFKAKLMVDPVEHVRAAAAK